jgi:hypothetical protein
MLQRKVGGGSMVQLVLKLKPLIALGLASAVGLTLALGPSTSEAGIIFAQQNGRNKGRFSAADVKGAGIAVIGMLMIAGTSDEEMGLAAFTAAVGITLFTLPVPASDLESGIAKLFPALRADTASELSNLLRLRGHLIPINETAAELCVGGDQMATVEGLVGDGSYPESVKDSVVRGLRCTAR